MKKRLFAPLVLTSLGLALAGCGGESATVNEDPNKGIQFHFQVTVDGIAYDGKNVIYQSYRDGHYEAYFGINSVTKEIMAICPNEIPVIKITI